MKFLSLLFRLVLIGNLFPTGKFAWLNVSVGFNYWKGDEDIISCPLKELVNFNKLCIELDNQFDQELRKKKLQFSRFSFCRLQRFLSTPINIKCAISLCNQIDADYERNKLNISLFGSKKRLISNKIKSNRSRHQVANVKIKIKNHTKWQNLDVKNV